MVGCRLLSSNPLLVESFAYHTALALSQRSQSRYRKNFPFLFLARFLLFLLLIHSSYVFASRPNGALLGDKGTRFFHATTVCRRQRNRIQRLRLENGVLMMILLKDQFSGIFNLFSVQWSLFLLITLLLITILVFLVLKLICLLLLSQSKKFMLLFRQ